MRTVIQFNRHLSTVKYITNDNKDVKENIDLNRSIASFDTIFDFFEIQLKLYMILYMYDFLIVKITFF